MSPRTGRPKIEQPKNIDVKVRFSQADHDKLLEYCKKHDMTRTEVIRMAVSSFIGAEK